MRFLFYLLIIFNFLFGYYKIDPKIISVSGAYNTLAVGYQSVGVNPACPNQAAAKAVVKPIIKILIATQDTT